MDCELIKAKGFNIKAIRIKFEKEMAKLKKELENKIK